MDKIWNRIRNAAIAVNSWVRVDGWLHMGVSALIMAALGWIRPIWVAACITLCVGVAKEVYDAPHPDKHSADWHDVACDAIGVLVGLLIAFLNSLA